MSVGQLADVLGWGLFVNYLILLLWFAGFKSFHDWIYSLHGRWFVLDVKTFDAIHYTGMALYKIGIFLFFLGPYIGLRIVE